MNAATSEPKITYRPNRKLTAEQVREIRASPKTQVELGLDYNIDPASIGRIKQRKLYAWVK